eukprot:7690138-Pyramimonas_sp.AAC.1
MLRRARRLCLQRSLGKKGQELIIKFIGNLPSVNDATIMRIQYTPRPRPTKPPTRVRNAIQSWGRIPSPI